MQHVLRYVSATTDRGRLYRYGNVKQLVGYTDADWAEMTEIADPHPGSHSLLGASRSHGVARSN